MNHFFSLKSLVFYGSMIGSVLLLFGVTTTYGEQNLKATSNIEGRYQIATHERLGCLEAAPLVLSIQQSGRYLTGALLPANANAKQLKTAEEKPSLSGAWNDRQFTLQGSTGTFPNCQTTLTLQGNREKDTLSGTLRLGSATETRFTAQLQTRPETAAPH